MTTPYKKVVATSISDQSEMSLRPKIRRFYNVFATSLSRLGFVFLLSNLNKEMFFGGRCISTVQQAMKTNNKNTKALSGVECVRTNTGPATDIEEAGGRKTMPFSLPLPPPHFFA